MKDIVTLYYSNNRPVYLFNFFLYHTFVTKAVPDNRKAVPEVCPTWPPSLSAWNCDAFNSNLPVMAKQTPRTAVLVMNALAIRPTPLISPPAMATRRRFTLSKISETKGPERMVLEYEPCNDCSCKCLFVRFNYRSLTSLKHFRGDSVDQWQIATNFKNSNTCMLLNLKIETIFLNLKSDLAF